MVCMMVVVGAGLVREALRQTLGMCQPALKGASIMRFPAWEGPFNLRAPRSYAQNIDI
jgi:hypothetical protein